MKMIDLTELPTSYEECTDDQKKFFDGIAKKAENRIVAHKIKKCWLCNQKFDKSLYDLGYKDHWNYPFLVHMKTTHGIDPEIIEDFVLN